MNKRVRRWCYTLNNPTDDEVIELFNLDDVSDKVRYHIFQIEQGNEETVHAQGYLEFYCPMKFNAVKNLVKRAHFENAIGSQKQNIHYCSKPVDNCHCKHCLVDPIRLEGPFEFGTPAKFNNIERIANLIIKDKWKPSKVAECFPSDFIKNSTGIEKLFDKTQKNRAEPPEIIILFGPTGYGKSWRARQYNDPYTVPWPTGNRWWWPDYENQETVILDEFRHQIKYDTMLKFLDRYEFNVEYKGGNKKFNSKRIVITSNIEPADWYPNLDQETKEPLKRRINEFASIYQFVAPPTVLEPGKLKIEVQKKNAKEFKFNPKVLKPSKPDFNFAKGPIPTDNHDPVDDL